VRHARFLHCRMKGLLRRSAPIVKPGYDKRRMTRGRLQEQLLLDRADQGVVTAAKSCRPSSRGRMVPWSRHSPGHIAGRPCWRRAGALRSEN
jgi:hypothetical protein